jgi:hypothetical protein
MYPKCNLTDMKELLNRLRTHVLLLCKDPRGVFILSDTVRVVKVGNTSVFNVQAGDEHCLTSEYDRAVVLFLQSKNAILVTSCNLRRIFVSKFFVFF